ncbi:MAG: DoxX family protein [Acidobacteria bacterium]|nr:DoxX family protein [Acidobacteriota bacterium]
MQRYLGPYANVLYALLRIVAGLLFAQHGVQKVLGALGGRAVPLVSLTGLAGLIELIGGMLIALGLFTPFAAFVASGEMAVAYFRSHFPQGFWPIQNRGELAALYCFVFLYLASVGSGLWSLDRLFFGGGRPGRVR